MTKRLFPADLPELEWVEFRAEGFSRPVPGAIYGSGRPPCCGVPVGGISTGCIDIDARGVYGFSTLFNPSGPHPLNERWRIPRRVPGVRPFLGLAVGGDVWVLTTGEMIGGGEIPWCTEPQMLGVRGGRAPTLRATCAKVEGVRTADAIHYWGHYPVADLEFDTDSPISVGLRAWSPFVPGDAAASSIPAAVFEVHLRNISDRRQVGTIALDSPGPGDPLFQSVRV